MAEQQAALKRLASLCSKSPGEAAGGAESMRAGQTAACWATAQARRALSTTLHASLQSQRFRFLASGLERHGVDRAALEETALRCRPEQCAALNHGLAHRFITVRLPGKRVKHILSVDAINDS